MQIDGARNDLLLRALRREATPRRPVWIMRQAGRFLPEYRALRATHTFQALMSDPATAAEVTLLPLTRFPLDAAIVFADLMSPVPALGLDVRFEPGPVLDTPIRTARDLDALREPGADEVAPVVMETLKRVRRELAGRAVLVGFAGAPLTLAAYLVEGGARRDFPRLRAMAAADEVLFGKLLERLSRLVAHYLLEQIRAGAEVVQVFDSWAGILSPYDWRRLVRPHLLALMEEVGRGGVPRVLYFHGAPHLLDAYAEMPAEAIGVDWRVDLARMFRRHPSKAWQGNLDPAVLLSGAGATRRATERLLARVPARGHVVNLGHGILPDTPLDSVEALITSVHAEAAAPGVDPSGAERERVRP